MQAGSVAEQNLCYNCFAQLQQTGGECPYCGFDPSDNAEKYPLALPMGCVLAGRYLVGRVLGQGGFGITYLAFDRRLQMKVAVKEFLPAEIARRTGLTVSVTMQGRQEAFDYGLERFQDEARTLARFIGTPNIASTIDFFDENGTSYFVMEYIEGISFKNYIANHGGRVSVEEAYRVLCAVLQALTVVHGAGLVHRDVTPDNIYISKNGTVKLLDFGSARYSLGDKSHSLDVILKVGYAPKEQYIRRSRQGPFTDVYSAAACFYAAVTGFLPPESLERLEEDTLLPLTQAGVPVPAWLDQAILKALAVRAEDRYQTAEEFLRAIEGRPLTEPVRPSEKTGLRERIQTELDRRRAVAEEEAAKKEALRAKVAAEEAARREAAEKKAAEEAARRKAAEEQAAREAEAAAKRKAEEDARLAAEQAERERQAAEAAARRKAEQERKEAEAAAKRKAEQERKEAEAAAKRKAAEEKAAARAARQQAAREARAAKPHTKKSAGKRTAVIAAAAAAVVCAAGAALLLQQPKGEPQTVEAAVAQEQRMPVNICGQEYDPALQTLDLTDSTLTQTDAAAIGELKELRSLRLTLDSAQLLTGLSLPALQELQVTFTDTVYDLRPIGQLKTLTSLELSGEAVQIPDYTDLSGLTGLQALRITTHGVQSLQGLEPLAQMHELMLRDTAQQCTYPDTAPLAGMKGLQVLELPAQENAAHPLDISGLSGLRELQMLQIPCCVKDIAPLAELTKLQTLSVQLAPEITDLAALQKLTALRELRLESLGDYWEQTGLEDISALQGLTGLQTLCLTGDRIADITALGALPELSHLELTGSSISDLTPLRDAQALRYLSVTNYGYGTPKVTDWSPVEHVETVEKNQAD